MCESFREQLLSVQPAILAGERAGTGGADASLTALERGFDLRLLAAAVIAHRAARGAVDAGAAVAGGGIGFDFHRLQRQDHIHVRLSLCIELPPSDDDGSCPLRIHVCARDATRADGT